MSRVSDLENKVASLERNVGMLAKEACLDYCLMISDYSSISKYRDGIECGFDHIKKDKGTFNIRETKIALVINGTTIHEYDGTAIYDLHTPSKLAYIWKTEIFAGGGVIRSMTVSDIKKFFEDNPKFAEPEFFDIVQDINHMSDIYILTKQNKYAILNM